MGLSVQNRDERSGDKDEDGEGEVGVSPPTPAPLPSTPPPSLPPAPPRILPGLVREHGAREGDPTRWLPYAPSLRFPLPYQPYASPFLTNQQRSHAATRYS